MIPWMFPVRRSSRNSVGRDWQTPRPQPRHLSLTRWIRRFWINSAPYTDCRGSRWSTAWAAVPETSRGPVGGSASPAAMTGRSFRGLAEQFADARDDLAAVQLDVGHELVVRQARHAVLQVEPGGPQGAEVRGDLLRDGFR